MHRARIVSIASSRATKGEPAGRHYALVISPWRVNNMSSLTLLAPITSRDNGYPLHVWIAEGNPIRDFVQCEALRAVDLGVREQEGAVEIIGAVDDATLYQVLACVLVVIEVEQP